MKRAFGTHRTVYLIGRWAIKVPAGVEWRLFLLGLLANMQEARFSAMGRPELCPVLFAFPGGLFNVMRRADPVDIDKFFELYPSEALFWEFRDQGDYLIPVEYKPDSVGMLDGQMVAVDYGS